MSTFKTKERISPKHLILLYIIIKKKKTGTGFQNTASELPDAKLPEFSFVNLRF